MCNSYRITVKAGTEDGLRTKVSAVASKLASSLVRKSDPGVVVLAHERVEIMRWGFSRSFNPSINNARSDKLEGGMWAASFRERRCVIPMTLFYEWGAAPGARKQAHEFRDPDDDFLWVAGIWEDDSDLGRCYSMVTTAASPLMAPIHDRMPAILRPNEMLAYLAGGRWEFQPFCGMLAITPCVSPLTKRTLPDPQQELF